LLEIRTLQPSSQLAQGAPSLGRQPFALFRVGFPEDSAARFKQNCKFLPPWLVWRQRTHEAFQTLLSLKYTDRLDRLDGYVRLLALVDLFQRSAWHLPGREEPVGKGRISLALDLVKALLPWRQSIVSLFSILSWLYPRARQFYLALARTFWQVGAHAQLPLGCSR
jgi:hypothetical protein